MKKADGVSRLVEGDDELEKDGPAQLKPGERFCKRCKQPFKPTGRWDEKCPKCYGKFEGLSEQIVVLLLAPPESGQCTACGQPGELRPYGEEGAMICFKCGMGDEQGTSKRFLDLFHGAVKQGQQEQAAQAAAAEAMGYGYLKNPQIQG